MKTPKTVREKTGLAELMAAVKEITKLPDVKARKAAFRACRWVLVAESGDYVQEARSATAPHALGPLATALVFDGWDNEVLKVRYFQSVMSLELDAEMLPQTGRKI
jgi:hypothetical protein